MERRHLLVITGIDISSAIEHVSDNVLSPIDTSRKMERGGLPCIGDGNAGPIIEKKINNFLL